MTVINDLDPRTKMLLTACLSTLAIIIPDYRFLIGLLLLSLIILAAFGLNPLGLAKRIKLLIYVVVFVAVMQSIFTSGGQPLIAIGPVHLVSTEGMKLAVEFMLRIGVIVASAGILSTSNSREIIQGMVQMKMPFEIAFMTTMGIRFLPVFAEEFNNTMVAVQLRGVDLKALPLRQKMEVFAGVIQPVAAGALIKSRAVAMSVEMRGFRASSRRTSYLILDLDGRDYGVMLAALLPTILTIACYYGLY